MTTAIPCVTLSDGARVPQIGLGLGNVPEDQTAATVLAAMAAGYRLFDTAAAYKNEAGVGEALANADIPREDLCISTKLSKANLGYDSALAAFDESLERLKLSYIDLYLIHFPVPALDLYVDSWKALVRLRDEGRARSIGVANFAPDHLRRLLDETGVVPVVNQVELHPTYQQPDLVAAHAALGIVTEAWSPLGYGAAVDHPTVRRIAAKHGRTPAQAILRWHVQNGVVAIPKSVNPGRMAENLAVFDFELDGEDMAALAGLDDPKGRTGPDPLKFGEPGYTRPPDRTPAGLAARRAAAAAEGRDLD